MKDDADTLRVRLERLLELTELARHAPLEDRASIEHSIQLVSRAIAAIAENQEARQRAVLVTEEAKACQVRRRSALADQMARLRFLRSASQSSALSIKSLSRSVFVLGQVPSSLVPVVYSANSIMEPAGLYDKQA
jgi:hypothetical protein